MPTPSGTSIPPTASEMLDSVRAEAVELRSFTITFLSLLIYLSLIVVATDHEQILRVAPVTLPLLDVKIPILGFYKFMPPFLFFMHLYILVQHYLFSQLAFKFEDALRLESIPMQDSIRRRLGNLPFMHWLLGRRGTFIQFIMVFISLISLVIWPLIMFWWMQASFLPYHDEGLVFWQQFWLSIDVLMLAYLWAKILDKTDSVLHWWRQLMKLGSGFHRLGRCGWRYTHLHCSKWRIAISSRPISVWLGLWLQIGWQIMLNRQHRLRMQVALGNMWTGFIRLLMALLLLTTLGFSWLVSITPDSDQEKRWLQALLWFESQIGHDATTYWLLRDVNVRKSETFFVQTTPRLLFKPTAWLHEKKFITVTVKQPIMDDDPARVTEIDCNDDKNNQGQNPSKNTEVEDPDKGKTQKNTAEKTQCYLVDSLLPRNMILRERLLTADAEVKPELAAALAADQEQVAASKLNEISPLDLKGRNFDYADFSESSLPRVDLRRASLKHANLHNARLEKAQLTMTILDSSVLNTAKLAGADLSVADLVGVDLDWADLVGADLSGADLAGSYLRGAKLIGAYLFMANLAGADLTKAELAGAKLNLARLAGADLRDARLAGADLKKAELAGAILPNSYLPLTDAKEINELVDKYRIQLEKAPAYQTADGKKTIEKKVTKLRKRVGEAAKFSKISLTGAPCIANEPQLAEKIGCLIWDKANQQNRDKVLSFWITQACEDSSNGKIAKSITNRALQKKFRSKDYAWLGLAIKLQQAAQDTKACLGLATLPEDLKNGLKTAALEQAKVQKLPLPTQKLKKRTKSHHSQTSKRRKTTATSVKHKSVTLR